MQGADSLPSPNFHGRMIVELDAFISENDTLNAYYVVESPKRRGSGVIFERWHASGNTNYIAGTYRVRRMKSKKPAFDVHWKGPAGRWVPVDGERLRELSEIATQIDRMGRF